MRLMLGAAVPGLAPGSNSKAPTKQNPPTACVPHPVIIAVAPRIPRSDGPQQRTDPPVEPDSEDEDVIMIDQDIDGLSDQFHDAVSPKRGTADAQRQVSSPQHKQWVTLAETVGLYCQAQVGGNCALHALNAMAGRPIITPDEAQALLRHPQVPSPADSERPDCNTDGRLVQMGGYQQAPILHNNHRPDPPCPQEPSKPPTALWQHYLSKGTGTRPGTARMQCTVSAQTRPLHMLETQPY